MFVECLIKRDGPTNININGFIYSFVPGEDGRSVCAVNSREHRGWLLGFPHLYREYISEERQEAHSPVDVPKEPEVEPAYPPMPVILTGGTRLCLFCDKEKPESDFFDAMPDKCKDCHIKAIRNKGV